MERKGIETDKGNYNREIRKYNDLVKTIKEEIKTLKGWIGNLLDNLSNAYEKFKDIERDKVIANPTPGTTGCPCTTYRSGQSASQSCLAD